MRGKLIVFEGLDGAGKSTQIELLGQYLKQQGFPVVVTGWNSSRLISKAIKRAKKAKLLTPYLYSTLHAADFLYRLENIILPALNEGYIVIADRYVYTGLARDRARNIDPRWIETIYALAPDPDLAFYCATSVEESLDRIIERRGGRLPAFYEAGMDIVGKDDPLVAFREFQTRIASEYEWISRENGLIEIESTQPIEAIHQLVISVVQERMKQWKDSASPVSTATFMHRFPGKRTIEQPPYESPTLVPHSFSGKLIVIESADRKATALHANLLCNELLVRGYDARLALMGRSWITLGIANKVLRKSVLSLPVKLLLSASEIALYYEQVIMPTLKSGAIVVMDGYLANVFAGYVASGVDPEWFRTMYEVFGVKPDRTILLDTTIRELMQNKSFRTLLNIPGVVGDEHLYDPTMQQAVIDLFRSMGDREGWSVISPGGYEKDIHLQIVDDIAQSILSAATAAGEPDDSLKEIFVLLRRYDAEFDHPRQVAALAVSIFDQTRNLHEYSDHERRLLLYAAFLHDIGHALSDDRHEEFTYEAIMRHRFATISETDREVIANIACLHRQPYSKMKFQYLARLNGIDQLLVKRLASLLRIADALDESGRRSVHNVRCYEESGVLYIDLHAVAKARPEREAVLRKSDMFERVYQKPVVVARNWIEKRAREQQRQHVSHSPRTEGKSGAPSA